MRAVIYQTDVTDLWCGAILPSLCTLNSSVLPPLDQIALPAHQEQKICNMDAVVGFYMTSHPHPL